MLVVVGTSRSKRPYKKVGIEWKWWWITGTNPLPKQNTRLRARGATPSISPSPFYDEDEIENVAATLDESGSRKDQTLVKKLCLERDNYRCMATGIIDSDAGTQENPGPKAPTNLCHIIPFSLGKWNKSTEHQIAQVWATLKKLFPAIGLEPGEVNDPKNLMTLWDSAHSAFAAFSLAFEPTSEPNQYRMLILGEWHTVLLLHLPAPQGGPNGPRLVTFERHGGTAIDLPSPALLQMHAALAKVLHAPGMAKYMEDLVRDGNEIGCLAPSDFKEQTLLSHINCLAERGFAVTLQILANLVEEIVKSSVGHNWVQRFCQRHKDQIRSVYLRAIDHSRKTADNSLQEKIAKYKIECSNIYNFDEKGFLLGLLQVVKRIVSIESLKSKRNKGVSQDGSREFISLLAAICMDGTALPPALIYKGESRDMQDTWLEDFDDEKDKAYFAASENGWSNDEYELIWLQQVFNPLTKAKAGRSWRLLILNDHSSHINIKFISYADQNRILLTVLPPHSTHRLQPLDLVIFRPLAKAYSNELNENIRTGLGLIRTTKRDFCQLLKKVWEIAVIPSNIEIAFAAAGISPFNPERVLAKIVRLKTPPELLGLKTPTSIGGMRNLMKEINQQQHRVSLDIRRALHASEKFALDRELLLIENRNLQQALNRERKRRKRGKAMGLLDSSNPCQAQFFSPTQVRAAREQAAAAEALKIDSQARRQEAQLQRTILREKKNAEAAKRKNERQKAREEAARQREKAKEAAAVKRQIEKEQ
ncbi:predicted protein [Histoplasma mississippiense (nom. inval.)]|uniref:predicted protein n=1 Tax=Ajellomyces capsulatus (strain NAm1 / WU24) TaxID=2059318 RepID=UPI000157C314|nr:predicted protein [Histoplasma mississippiense (nom. inval.)]EDN07669.1 predicted protein [Histoplasma mississippiense (nom. inval.)]